MIIERIITFAVLGFFVFIAKVNFGDPDVTSGYTYYVAWAGLIFLCYLATSRTRTRTKSKGKS